LRAHLVKCINHLEEEWNHHIEKKKTYNLGIFKSSMNHIKQSYYKIAWNINKNIYIL
jgi:hypothetical protein